MVIEPNLDFELRSINISIAGWVSLKSVGNITNKPESPYVDGKPPFPGNNKIPLCIVSNFWYKSRPISPISAYQDNPMARVCQVTGKRTISGNNVSHAHNKTKRKFLPNLHHRRFWVESENRWVKLRISTSGLRMIDKKGIDTILSEMRSRGEKV